MKEIKNLLNQTNTLLKHEKEKQRLRGETFNVFSVLKMEHRENATHSAFIAELLNPRGSHLQKLLFAKLFIDMIKNKHEKSEMSLPIQHFHKDQNILVQLEKDIGKKDDDNKTGGRVDIYLKVEY